MSDNRITFFLDGEPCSAQPGQTILQAAQPHQAIPHLCCSDRPGFKSDGNCRACVVEIEGERALAPSCRREVSEGMRVNSAGSERVQRNRARLLELLVSDLPNGRSSEEHQQLHHWAGALGVSHSRFPGGDAQFDDLSHSAIRVNHSACINCQLCRQACQDLQVNRVIGLSGRGTEARIGFDLDDPLGDSTCVACGECVQACPTGALLPAAPLSRQPVEQRVHSICPYCGVGCQLEYQVSNDRIIAVDGRSGPSNEGRLCVKGRFGFDYINHADRLRVPLVRREDAPPKGAPFDPAERDRYFREASWEEALERACEGLVRLKHQHGASALAGLGSAKGSNEEAYLFQKLVRTGFGSNNVDHCTRLCHASSVAALLEGIGSGAVTASFMQVVNAEVAIVIGCNPESNHPVAANLFKQAARNGTQLVVIDSRGHSLREHASHLLQLTPGSDVALLNAMLHVIIRESLYDHRFVAERLEGFDALQAHLDDYSPEAMAPLCGIDAERIREVARLFARAERAMIFWGMGISQHTHGTDNVRCLIALALLCGQVGRPGTGLHPLRGQNNVQGASDAGLIPMMLPDYQRVDNAEARARFEQLWQSPLAAQPGLTVVEMIDAIHHDQIRGMYIMGENPAMSDPDLNHSRQALARLEHLVVQDLFITETAAYADVILPASAWPEKSGTVTNTNRQVQLGRPAVSLPGQCRQDWWIIQAIAQGMGLDWAYPGPEAIYREMQQAMPSLTHIDRERLERENSVTYPCPTPDGEGTDVLFADRFPTASGKARLVAATLLPPDETCDSQYPLILSTGRLLEHWHTGAMTRRSRVLDTLEPGAIVCAHPLTLREWKLQAGEAVRVESRRGAMKALLRADEAVPPGSLFIPFCFAEGAANLLTNPKLDPFGKIPEFKYCAVRLAPTPPPNSLD
ncbi:formate dehydrogenase subunit alpha [Aestuariirhabdus litorea]|uniref:Formate dehydrogenase subunit alpha n=1 Tax=Aestuariirhabdus litorea TaxID=2528527 RepID=A0A3P3VJ10_9GAMM|nr:formate dehydrogenase subunit alpha [Aestuariirhabdus litorea]RRJ82690.1 formate dehydrogenase subunit alpha [Aestuariirhabdus litorea]RWW92850.1 formate dehydrogenase subunit alpha [Endozoicomonadaceae bacterium GTF-13]